MLMKILFTYIFLVFCGYSGYSQTISGKISDIATGEGLSGATVKIKGTNLATSCDGEGNFTLGVTAFPLTLQIVYIGYEKKDIRLIKLPESLLKIELKEKEMDVTEVEIISSRISEKEKESPITVESMGVKQIKESAQSTFYEGLGNMKGVDITAASLGFRVINTRGFNSTSPVRSLQLIDGVDNQSPGLNFSLGNFLGASELDLKKVDIVSGASSAFFGPNAFNGVISMESKNPFETPGLTFSTKVGERQLREVSFRLAQIIKNKKGEEKLAYKVCLFSMSAYDWEATNYNPSSDSKKGSGNPGRFDAINIYGDEVLAPGNDQYAVGKLKTEYLGLGDFYRSGYKEKDIVDYNTNNNKFNAAVHYKITPKTELIYGFNMGGGSTVYQGDNRYSLKNIRFWQNKLEWRQKDKFFVRVYSTKEDAGDSYDAVFTAMRINKASIDEGLWYKSYSSKWIRNFKGKAMNLPGYKGNDTTWVKDSLDYFLDLYNDSLTRWHEQNLINVNRYTYGAYEVGTNRFDSLKNDITSRNFTDEGTRFYDKSALYNFQAEYKFTNSWGDIITGASGRLYRPETRGTIFKDTGGVVIKNYEFGLYAGYDKKSKDNHWKFNFTARLDKNQNFNFLLSPAASVLYLPSKEHTFRLTVSRAIRNPTLADQYLYYNIGRAILVGNLEGFDSLITLESFEKYRNSLDPGMLVYQKVAPIEPEKVLTIDAGYKAEINKSLFLDFGCYYSIYQSFIGYNVGVFGRFDEFGFPKGPIQAYRLAANSRDKVNTTGINAGYSYFFKKYSFTGNYSFNTINLRDTDDPIVPAFNTPKHKFNLGFSGRECKLPWSDKKRFGFGISYKWIERFQFTGSPQFTGFIRSYDMLDAQINYVFPKQYLTVKIGGSNLMGFAPLFRNEGEQKLKTMFDNRNSQVYGGPSVGRLAYISLLFEVPSK